MVPLFVLLALWLFFDRLHSDLFIRELRDAFALFLTIVVAEVVVILHFFDDSLACLRNHLTRYFFCSLCIYARFVSVGSLL